MAKIKVAVCEDMESINKHFVELISSRSDMEVVASAKSGAQIKELALKTKPDIILMDIQMESEKAGIEATKAISEQLPGANIIILTIHDDDKLIFEAFEAGAVDYILKSVPQNELFDAIINAYNKDVTLNHNIAQKIVSEFVKMKREKTSLMYLVNMMCNLSPTEIETLRYFCMGKTRREIAYPNTEYQRCIVHQARNALKYVAEKDKKVFANDLKSIVYGELSIMYDGRLF